MVGFSQSRDWLVSVSILVSILFLSVVYYLSFNEGVGVGVELQIALGRISRMPVPFCYVKLVIAVAWDQRL